jgi:hypothetical protein
MASTETHLGPAPKALWNVTDLNVFPVVRHRGVDKGTITILSIPNNPVIPSPLADNITPQQLQFIKSTCQKRESGNGPEVWKAWKRAWDLWNNFYIQGRANPRWIKNELARRKFERSKIDRKRGRNKQLDVDAPPKVHDYYTGNDPPPAEKGKKWVRGHFFNVPPELKSLRKTSAQNEKLGERFWELIDNLKELDAVRGVKKQRVITADGVEHGEDETQDVWWSNTGHDETGNSAGLVALKFRAEYHGEGLEDKVANTVWRSVRVGAEGTDDVMEFDDWWNEVERVKTSGINLVRGDSVRVAGHLEVDGGVDCGGGPFPVSLVLRLRRWHIYAAGRWKNG